MLDCHSLQELDAERVMGWFIGQRAYGVDHSLEKAEDADGDEGQCGQGGHDGHSNRVTTTQLAFRKDQHR